MMFCRNRDVLLQFHQRITQSTEQWWSILGLFQYRQASIVEDFLGNLPDMCQEFVRDLTVGIFDIILEDWAYLILF